MRRDLPDAARLLDLARRLLLRDLAPSLPRERRGDVAQIARAMAIAERELLFGAALSDSCRAALERHYGKGDAAELMCRLANEIRAGAYDRPGPAREDVRRLLWLITVQKLRESNPDYLAASGIL